MRVDYAMIPDLHRAARRHRAEVLGGLIAAAFAWLVSRKHVVHAPRPHFAR